MHRHRCDGLNAENPLGFFAALGLLRVLDDHARLHRLPTPRLAFVDRGYPAAEYETSLTRPELEQAVLDDAAACANDPVLGLAYDDSGARVGTTSKGAIRDLKPRPVLARVILEEAAGASRRSADVAAAAFTEIVTDNNGNAKPTAFHFTAGQQEFLSMLSMLREALSVEHLTEALDGPWLSHSPLPSLSWDSSAARFYALRANDPSSEKKGSVPGAYWLGSVGLTALPVLARRGRLETTGVRGGWKTGSFVWPVWSQPASFAAVRTLLSVDWSRENARARSAVGVLTVLRSRITRSDQGGYGAFSPAEPVLAGAGLTAD